MKRFLWLLVLFGITLLTYDVIFAVNPAMVRCNEGGVGHAVTFGLHSCVWGLGFFALYTFFLVSACVVFFKTGPIVILKEMWEKRGKIALLLVAAAVVFAVVSVGVIQVKKVKYPLTHPGPWYDIF